MAKREKVTREEILAAAAEIVKSGGVAALNARAVARALGCSTQPVYSRFAGMGALRAALYEEGKARYRRFIEGYFGRTKTGYEAYGMGFVAFAREERGFFRMLFLESDAGDPFLDAIIGEMEKSYRIPAETARAFHADMTVFSYGLASRVYAGAPLAEAEIERAFAREFYALYAYYLPGRPRFWE